MIHNRSRGHNIWIIKFELYFHIRVSPICKILCECYVWLIVITVSNHSEVQYIFQLHYILYLLIFHWALVLQILEKLNFFGCIYFVEWVHTIWRIGLSEIKCNFHNIWNFKNLVKVYLEQSCFAECKVFEIDNINSFVFFIDIQCAIKISSVSCLYVRNVYGNI